MRFIRKMGMMEEEDELGKRNIGKEDTRKRIVKGGEEKKRMI